jgi:hypothetical protein
MASAASEAYIIKTTAHRASAKDIQPLYKGHKSFAPLHELSGTQRSLVRT